MASYERDMHGINAAQLIEVIEQNAPGDPFMRVAGTVELFDADTKERIALWDCAPTLTKRG